jgi:hypothetical protein
LLPRLSKSSMIISRGQSTSRRWLWLSRALSSTYLQGLRTILDFLGLFSSSLLCSFVILAEQHYSIY